MKHESIIFDIFGVLFYLRIRSVLKHIGLAKLIMYTIRNHKTPFHTFFAILDKMRTEVPGEYQDIVTYQGYYLPNSICEWQRGKLSSALMLERLIAFINRLYKEGYFKNKEEKDLIIKAAKAAFEPKQLLQACTLNRSMVTLIKQLKQEQYGLYVLSNIDEEIFSQLQRQYQSFFDQFNGIVTSFKTQYLKPEKEIYFYLLNQYNLRPTHCCFIDDQKENIMVAQSIGMKTILYKKGENITKALKRIW